MIFHRQTEQSVGNVLQYGIHRLQYTYINTCTQYISIDEIATVLYPIARTHYRNRSRNEIYFDAQYINFQSITTRPRRRSIKY